MSTIKHFQTKAPGDFEVQDSLCATKVNCEDRIVKVKAPAAQGSYFG